MTRWILWRKHQVDSYALLQSLRVSKITTAHIVPTISCSNTPAQTAPDLPTLFPIACQTSFKETFSRPSQCQKCGACCAFFRVRFPASESNSCLGGSVPIDLTVLLDDATRYMQGTETTNPRCIALHGQVGTNVSCSIYLCRPSCCRNFLQSWKNEAGNTLCDRARAVFGLQPFSQY
jgi:uncharacterized protein